MFRNKLLIRALLAFFLVVAGVGVAGAEETPEEPVLDEEERCEVVAVPAGLRCEGVDGEEVWSIRHMALRGSREEDWLEEAGALPVGPVAFGDHVLYGVRSDLLKTDARTGQVQGRWRLPAEITGIEAAESGEVVARLRVVPDFLPGTEYESLMTLDLNRPRHQFGRWYGDNLGLIMFTTRHDARGFVVDLFGELEGAELAAAVREAMEQDRTNLLLIGQLLHLDWDGALAAEELSEILRTALTMESIPWQDLIALSWHLEEAGQFEEEAEAFFARGFALMEGAGVMPERVVSAVPMVVMHLDGRRVMGEKVAAEDWDAVHRLSERIAKTSPLVEGGDTIWSLLADWFEEQGMGEEAVHWRARAERNSSEGLDGMAEFARKADRSITWLGGFTLALYVWCALIGLAAGRRRRVRWEVISVPILLAGVVMVAVVLVAQIETVERFAVMPLDLVNDSLSSPKAERWLGEQGEYDGGEVFEALKQISEEERRRLLAGEPAPEKEAFIVEVGEAVYADVLAKQWVRLRHGEVADPLSAIASVSESEFQDMSLVDGFGLLLILGLLVVLGAVVGRKLPGLAKWILRLVPGGARPLAPVGGLLLAAFFAGVLAVLGVDSILTDLSTPNLQRYFALEALPLEVERPQPSRLWAYVTIVAVIAVQVVAAEWERRGESSQGGG